MMRRGLTLGWLLLGAALVFGGYNLSIHRQETLLANGEVVRLALAPRDPRALMTGDYMTLDYAIAREAARFDPETGEVRPATTRMLRRADIALPPRDAFVVVTLSADRVARLVRVQPERLPLADGERVLLMRVREGRVRIGTDAWYFQEGQAQRFDAARFGEFRVDGNGNLLLTRMLDEKLRPL